MNMKDFLKMFNTEEQSPCEKFSCRFNEKCAEERLACQSFGTYVRHGKPFAPGMMFNGGRKFAVDPKFVPTRKLFDAAMADDGE